jgi:hypothetical protein
MKPIAAGAIMGISIYYVNTFNVLIVVAIASVVYFVTLLALGGVSNEDIKLIKGVLKKDTSKF